MGKLTPGATYIYERTGNKIYARESGKAEKFLVGYHNDSRIAPMASTVESDYAKIQEDQLWGQIRKAAVDNLPLQKALEQCIIIYHLTKDNEQEPVAWHPV